MVVKLKDFHELRQLHSFGDKAIIVCSEDNNKAGKFHKKEEATADWMIYHHKLGCPSLGILFMSQSGTVKL